MYKILVSKNQHYSCLRCGRCCKRFNVRIEWDEILRIQNLDWGTIPHPTDFFQKINGHYYFRRKPDGGCIFLDEEGVCTIHKHFGYDVKALTCRGYPMNIISIAPGELSVLARMDCPAVLSNHGAPLKDAYSDVQRMVSEMQFGTGFTEKHRAGLTREACDYICKECHTLVRDTQLPLPKRLLWLAAVADECQLLGAPFVNDLTTFKKAWIPILRRCAQQVMDAPTTHTSAMLRANFRNYLALYCRCDEEKLSRSLFTRLAGFWKNLSFIFGWGSFRGLGEEHPAISPNKANLFSAALDIGDEDAWKPYFDFVINRLDTFQFFGAAFYDCNVYDGLRGLARCFPLVLAIAKAHAANDHRTTLTADDVFKAVLAVDHAHGRSPSLNSKLARLCEHQLCGKKMAAVVHDLLTPAHP